MSLLSRVATLAELSYAVRAEILASMEAAERVEAERLLGEMGIDFNQDEEFDPASQTGLASQVSSPKAKPPVAKLLNRDHVAETETAESDERLCMPRCVNCALRGSTCRGCKRKGRVYQAA